MFSTKRVLKNYVVLCSCYQQIYLDIYLNAIIFIGPRKLMKQRLDRIARMSEEQRLNSIHQFWNLPEDAVFSPEVVALVCDMSLSWLQAKRCQGNGIPFVKVGPRKVGYTKRDVLEFLGKNRYLNTSQPN